MNHPESTSNNKDNSKYPLPAGVGVWFVFLITTSIGYCRTWVGWPIVILNLVELYWICYRYKFGKRIVIIASYILAGIFTAIGICATVDAARTNTLSSLYLGLCGLLMASCYCLIGVYFQSSKYIKKALYK